MSRYLQIIECDGRVALNDVDEKYDDGEIVVDCTKTVPSELRIPENVTEIGITERFINTGISSIFIPQSVKWIIITPSFFHCIRKIKIDERNLVYDSRNDCNAIIETATNTLVCACQNTVIPNSITHIDNRAFRFVNSKSKEITFPKGILSIGKEAFAYNESIDTLIFNGKFPTTWDSFKGCNIKKVIVNLPKKLAGEIPDDIQKALGKDGEIIYATPDFWNAESTIPGYIKATLVTNEEEVEINTKYIVSIEPCELRHYTNKGSSITLAVPGREVIKQIHVHEPCEMINKKIAFSLEQLGTKVGGVAGLLDVLESLLKQNRSNCTCHE